MRGKILLAAYFLLLLLLIDNDPRNMNNDNKFLIYAKNLAEGNGISNAIIDGFSYLPNVSEQLLPFIMSIVFLATGYTFCFPRVIIALFSTGAIYLAYRLYCKHAPKHAMLLTLFTAANFTIIFQSTVVEPEIPYLFFSMAAIYYADKAKRGMPIAVLAFLTVMSYLFRAPGIALIPALALTITDFKFWPIKARRIMPAVIFLALTVLPFIAGILLVMNSEAVLPNGMENYLLLIDMEFFSNQSGSLLALLIKPAINALGYIYLLPALFANSLLTVELSDAVHYNVLPTLDGSSDSLGLPGSTVVKLAMYIGLGAILCAAVLAGWAYSFFRRRTALEWYFLFYGGILLLYHYRILRFIVPLLPLMILYAYRAVMLLAERFEDLPIKKAALALACILVITNIGQIAWHAVAIRTDSDYDPNMKDAIDMGMWASQNIPGSRIMTRWGRFGYDLEGLRELPYPHNLQPEEVYRKARENDVRYVLQDSLPDMEGAYMWNEQAGPEPFIDAYKDRLIPIHAIGNTTLYEITFQ